MIQGRSPLVEGTASAKALWSERARPAVVACVCSDLQSRGQALSAFCGCQEATEWFKQSSNVLHEQIRRPEIWSHACVEGEGLGREGSVAAPPPLTFPGQETGNAVRGSPDLPGEEVFEDEWLWKARAVPPSGTLGRGW